MAKIIGENEFNTIINTPGIKVVDFFATWCGPCAMVAPIFRQAEEDLAGKAGFYKVDVDESRDISDKYDIDSIPALIFFDSGKEVERIIGVASLEKIKSTISKISGEN